MGEYPMLKRGIVWATERPSERKVTEQPTRWGRALELALDDAEGDRGQAVLFEDMCERAHGTRTQRSNGREKHHVDTGIEQHLGALGATVEPNALDLELIACIGQVHVGNRTDGSVVCQLL